MTIETVEGDWVVKGQGRDLFRLHMTKESMHVTIGEARTTRIIVCDISEATELRDWLTRRLNEEIE